MNKFRKIPVILFFSVWGLIVPLSYGEDPAVYYWFDGKWGKTGSGIEMFSGPSGIAVDKSGFIFVTNHYNNQIQKFTPEGKFLLGWGGAGNGEGEFSKAVGVAVDAEGLIYVADHMNHRVQKFSKEGEFLLSWGGPGVEEGRMNLPVGIDVDLSGNILVADSDNHRIQIFSPTGKYLAKWGRHGKGDGQFLRAIGVAVDRDGQVFVADFENHRIQKFSSSGTFILKWGRQGKGDGEFKHPVSVQVDDKGNVFVAEFGNHRIQKFDNNGTFLAKWGRNLGNGTAGNGDGQFREPFGVAVDSMGRVFVTDHANNRVQRFVPTSKPPEKEEEKVEEVPESVTVRLPAERPRPMFRTAKPHLAVGDLEANNVPPSVAKIVSDYLSDALVNAKRFEVIERSRMEEILKEQAFQKSGCTTVECAVQIGQLLNVEMMIVGSVNRLGDTYSLSVRGVNVEKSSMAFSKIVECESESALRRACQEAARAVVRDLFGF